MALSTDQGRIPWISDRFNFTSYVMRGPAAVAKNAIGIEGVRDPESDRIGRKNEGFESFSAAFVHRGPTAFATVPEN